MLFNRDTGQPIRWARWAEVPADPNEPGEYEAFLIDPAHARAMGIPLEVVLHHGRARLRFVAAAPRTHTPDPGESLAEARRRLGIALPPMIGVECDEPGCHALARWSVADVQEISPAVTADGQAEERHVLTGRRRYCHRHYQGPTITNLRGVTREPEVTARPQ
jgi:hypothetical protein